MPIRNDEHQLLVARRITGHTERRVAAHLAEELMPLAKTGIRFAMSSDSACQWNCDWSSPAAEEGRAR